MLNIEAQDRLILKLYELDRKAGGSPEPRLFEIGEEAGIKDKSQLLIVMHQFQKKGLLERGGLMGQNPGPPIMITPEGREYAERLLIEIEKDRSKGKIGF